MVQTTAYSSQPKPLGKLFKWLRIFFIAYIIASVFIVIGDGLILAMGSYMFGLGEPLSIGDGISGFAALFLITFYSGSVVLFSIFSYRAIKNLGLLGVEGIKTTPGWAAGWYFIPIANLWKPYGVMKEMWQGSMQNDDQFRDVPSTMSLWWMCWLAASIASNISLRMSISAGVFDEYLSNVSLYKASLMVDIFAALTGIVAAWLILGILRSITKIQDARISSAIFT